MATRREIAFTGEFIGARRRLEIDGREVTLPPALWEMFRALVLACVAEAGPVPGEELQPAAPKNAAKYVYKLRRELGRAGVYGLGVQSCRAGGFSLSVAKGIEIRFKVAREVIR